MSSTRDVQFQMKICKVLTAYVVIQMFILAIDLRVEKSNGANVNMKTRNITYTVEIPNNCSTVIRQISSSSQKRSAQNASHIYCNGRYKIYNNYFVVLSKVIVDPSKCTGKRKGGEDVSEVLNQTESDEYCIAEPGFFKMSCEQKPYHLFLNKGHFRQWDASLEIVNESTLVNYTEQDVTFAIVRRDYANLYWVIVDLYDIYHVAHLLNLDIKRIEILIVDAHPSTPLDQLWLQLFPKVTRVSHLTHKVLCGNLVWGMRGLDSPLVKYKPTEKLFLQEFRYFVLSQIKHSSKLQELNCKNITITIVFRRDYVAHARNPSGRVNRKMSNDLQLLQSISNIFRGHNVKGVQLDILPVEEQIHLAAQTDILVGMHGAGLSHSVFLPSHAALVELFPLDFQTFSHFQFIAKWRNLTYAMWKNRNSGREKDKDSTTVDIPSIRSIIDKVYSKMCKGEN
ncbi:uncharacterized protein LOC132750351 [Ruditapes philippinarum]|uniref:uncharacterized protein LOC132750351 n=1 Tax=Ruditapes philippinarum TaxID=129788 RepID=UPI00295A9B5F|nr:uncharacterized protein LOC132750351 [Ruditapes philippinarum]